MITIMIMITCSNEMFSKQLVHQALRKCDYDYDYDYDYTKNVIDYNRLRLQS